MSNPTRRVAIATGAAGGIGSAIAARLEKDGVDVLAVDLDPDVTGCGPAPQGVPFAADLTTRIGNESAVRAALDEFGYVAAKHGALGLVKTLAVEGAEHGITACAITGVPISMDQGWTAR